MSKFSYTEQILIDIINKQPEKIKDMSISELSEYANVSTATIVRTTQKLGYSGYRDFKYHLQDHPHLGNLENVDTKTLQVIQQNQLEVTQTIAQLDIEKIEESLKIIEEAELIYLFARGLSELIAEEMVLKLQLLGKNVQFFHDPNIIRTIAKQIKPGAIAIFITLNGETLELVETAKQLQKTVPILTITTNSYGSINKYSSVVFIGYKSKTSYFPEYEVNSRLPLQVISRILVDSYVVRKSPSKD